MGLSGIDPYNLKPSSQFSVNAAILVGLPSDRITSLGTTLEDMFTLLHQNLLASTALLTKNIFSAEHIKNSPLPPLLQSAVGSISKIGGVDDGPRRVNTPELTGIEVDHSRITFYYNVPLRVHSGKVLIHYNRKINTISFEGQFLGVSFHDRWAIARERLEILNFAKILNLQSQVKMLPDEICFKWNIETEEHLTNAFKEFQAQAMNTYVGQSSEDNMPEFIADVTKVKDVSAIVNFLLNENKNRLSDYGHAIVEIFLKESQDFHKLTDSLFLRLFEISLSSKKELRNSLISLLRGGNISEILKGKTNGRNFIENALIRFQKDPALIYQLPINSMTVDIWQELIAQSKGISEIFAKAKTEFMNPDAGVRNSALKLLVAMVKQGQLIPEIASLAQQALQDQHGFVRKSAILLLKEIAGQGQEIRDVIPLVQQALHDEAATIRESAVHLLRVIAGRGQHIAEIMPLAQQAFQDPATAVLHSAAFLLNEIVKHGQAVSEVISLARHALQDTRLEVKNTAISVLIETAKQGQAIPEFVSLAQQALGDRVWLIRRSAVLLLIEIAKQRQGIPELVPLAQQALHDDDSEVANLAAKLQQILDNVEK